jgi:hypothetical protein
MAGRPRGPRQARISDRIPAELVARIEAWRSAQPVPPSKVQTIVYLLERGLAAIAAPHTTLSETSAIANPIIASRK